MSKLALPLFTIFCLLVLLTAYWFFRPGSEYSPREVIAYSQLDDRREGFRVMDQIYPSVRVRPAERITTFERADRGLDVQYTWAGEQRTFDDYAARRTVQGIYILKDRKVVHERYFGEASPSDTYTSWSVAKSVISSLIGIAVKDGKISSLDDKASDYAIDYRGTDYGDTSIRHLLMMSSGIDFNENYEEPRSDIRRLFIDTFLWNKDVDDVVRGYKRDRPAGEVFDYISPNTQVLSAVLRGAYRQPLIKTFNEKLSEPLGLTGGTWLTDRQGVGGKVLGYCCLQLRLEDFAKIGQLYAQDGIVGKERILPQGWARFVAEPGTQDHQPKGEGQLGYGHHMWTIGGDDQSFTMQGYNGQLVHVDRGEGVVIVMVSADNNHPGTEVIPEFVRLFQAIKAELR